MNIIDRIARTFRCTIYAAAALCIETTYVCCGGGEAGTTELPRWYIHAPSSGLTAAHEWVPARDGPVDEDVGEVASHGADVQDA